MTLKTNRNIYLRVKDHSVSGEEFVIKKNLEFGYLETHPQPNISELPLYYQSENYISHTDSKRNLFEKIYHFVRDFSTYRKVNLINKYSGTGNKKLLDIGCGTGDFLYAAKKQEWIITGIEPNDKARNIAIEKNSNIIYDSNKLFEFKKESFDVITLWHVLEHLPNLENHISIIKKILKPNGVLIIAVPNYKSYDAEYYKEFWAAYDVPRHLWHFSKQSIGLLCAKFSLKVIKYKSMWYDSFYVSLLSEKYKTGKMNPIKGFLIGAISNIKALFSKQPSSVIYIIKSTNN